jgi:hypothetical protein
MGQDEKDHQEQRSVKMHLETRLPELPIFHKRHRHA